MGYVGPSEVIFPIGIMGEYEIFILCGRLHAIEYSITKHIDSDLNVDEGIVSHINKLVKKNNIDIAEVSFNDYILERNFRHSITSYYGYIDWDVPPLIVIYLKEDIQKLLIANHCKEFIVNSNAIAIKLEENEDFDVILIQLLKDLSVGTILNNMHLLETHDENCLIKITLLKTGNECSFDIKTCF